MLRYEERKEGKREREKEGETVKDNHGARQDRDSCERPNISCRKEKVVFWERVLRYGLMLALARWC